MGLLLIFGELGQLFVNELGQARIFCCLLVRSAAHFRGLVLGLLYGGPGIGFSIGGTLVGLVQLVPQCLLGLLGLV